MLQRVWNTVAAICNSLRHGFQKAVKISTKNVRQVEIETYTGDQLTLMDVERSMHKAIGMRHLLTLLSCQHHLSGKLWDLWTWIKQEVAQAA